MIYILDLHNNNIAIGFSGSNGGVGKIVRRLTKEEVEKFIEIATKNNYSNLPKKQN